MSTIDRTGRDRLVSNVIFSWGTHCVYLVAGFLLPRMIHQKLGRELLGVWDFGWSLVSYFRLVQAGIGSSVSRYVARYQAVGDISGINRIVSSAMCILTLSGFLALGLTIGTWFLLPVLFGTRLGDHVDVAKWVVLFLGASVSAQVFLGAYAGVLTGCHRWKIHNAIRTGFDIVSIAVMIAALWMGGGLRSLAAIVFLTQFVADGSRVIISHVICHGLRLSMGVVRRKTIANLFVFGGKTVIPVFSRFLLDQVTSILIVAYLGPGALAVFVRPRSLMHHVHVLVQRMAVPLTPIASSLQGTGKLFRIRELVVKSTRYSLYLVLPMMSVLAIFGESILHFWMGPEYASDLLPAVLAVGYSVGLVNLPSLSVLAGVNGHGRAGTGLLVASLCSVGLTVLLLGPLDLGLVGAAAGVTVPLAVVNAIYIPLLTCRRVGLAPREYLRSAVVGPIFHVLPFVLCLGLARACVQAKLLAGFVAGAAVAIIVLIVFYWRFAVPGRIKARFFRAKMVVAERLSLAQLP